MALLTGVQANAWMASPDPFWQLVHEEDREALRQSLLTEPAGTEMVHRQFRVRHPQTGLIGLWLEWRRRIPGEEVFEGYWVDHSLVWRLHRRMRALQGRELLGDMLPGYVHDLNNALTGITSLTDLCLLEMPQGHSMEAHLRQMAGNASSMRELLFSLVRFHEEHDPSRPAPSEWIDLARLIHDATGLARPAIPRRITLDLQESKASLPVVGERGVLLRGILQLLLNAARSIAGNGSIRIEAHESKPPSGLGRKGRYGCITVTDTGLGLAPGAEAAALDLTYSTRTGWKGLGAGLPLVRQALLDAGGCVTLKPHAPHGAQVRCYLPLASEEEDSGEHPSVPRDSGKPLLWVDLAGDGADVLVQKLQQGSWNLTRLVGEPERMLASGDVSQRRLVVWGGGVTQGVRNDLERLYRHRPRLSMLLVASREAESRMTGIADWAVDVILADDVGLLQRVERWYDGFTAS